MVDEDERERIGHYADRYMTSEAAFATMFGGPPYNHDHGRERLLILAYMVRNGTLPENGREYLGRALEKLADGERLEDLLPKMRTKEAASPAVIFASVERERFKGAFGHGDMQEVFARVGRRFGLEPSTVQKLASEGRTFVRAWLDDSLVAGTQKRKLLSELSQMLDLTMENLETVFADLA